MAIELGAIIAAFALFGHRRQVGILRLGRKASSCRDRPAKPKAASESDYVRVAEDLRFRRDFFVFDFSLRAVGLRVAAGSVIAGGTGSGLRK